MSLAAMRAVTLSIYPYSTDSSSNSVLKEAVVAHVFLMLDTVRVTK